MRIATLAILGVLATCVAFPAAAQRGYYPAYSAHEVCHREAVDNNSLVAGQHGYTEFMRECMGARAGTYASPR